MRSANETLHDSLPYPPATFAVELTDGERSFLCPADPEAVLEDISEERFRSDEQLPYWAEHWPAAAVAVRYFDRHSLPPGLTVCEIGCGLGVLSWALARCGATVVSFDIAMAGCAFAAANLARHGMPVRVLCADWRLPPFRTRFDRIVASDVLYEKRWVHPVLSFIDHGLTEGGMAYVIDPCRAHWTSFVTEAASRGFASTCEHRALVNGGKTTVEVLRLTRRG